MKASQSTIRTPRVAPDWMDRDNALEQSLRPGVWVGTDPNARLMRIRQEQLRLALTSLTSVGRMPRVCVYGLAVNGQIPHRSLAAAEAYAAEMGWLLSGSRTYVDEAELAGPSDRPTWTLVKSRIRSGFADGVVVLTRSLISRHDEAYERELIEVAEGRGFVALVHPELEVRGLGPGRTIHCGGQL